MSEWINLPRRYSPNLVFPPWDSLPSALGTAAEHGRDRPRGEQR